MVLSSQICTLSQLSPFLSGSHLSPHQVLKHTTVFALFSHLHASLQDQPLLPCGFLLLTASLTCPSFCS